MSALEEAIIQAIERLQESDDGPTMQLVRLRIAGVDYQCFAAVVDSEEGEVPSIEAIEFGDIVPMSMVIEWLCSAQEAWTTDQRKNLQ